MVDKLTLNYLATALLIFLQSACQLHTLSKETSVALCCVTKLHILLLPAQGAPV